jgi:2-polyprenyl-6-methoxyphenol hydroxylase-like FAD-dependent oxidoreductase
MHDVIVVGGGPAGLAVALGASRAGMDVVVFEKRQGSIDKACGEGLMPGALRALLALGVDPPGHDIRGITYRQGSVIAEAAFRHGLGRGVRRTILQEAMRNAVHQHGIPIKQETVTGVEQHGDYIDVAGNAARYVVAADGLHSPIRTAAGLSAVHKGTPRWGLRRHYAAAPLSDKVEVTWADASEAYVTPIARDTVGVAILSSARGSFDDQLAAFPDLADRLARAAPVSDVRGAGPLRQTVTRRVAGRILLVGDAAGYIDALTGEGLALSLAAAAELVACLAADRPDAYDRAWLNVSRRSRWLTGGLLWARNRPALSHRVVPLAARAPKLFSAAVDQLAR